MSKNDYEKARKIAEHLLAVAKGKKKRDCEEFERWVENNPSAYVLMQKLSDPERMTEFLQQSLPHSKERSARVLQKRIERRTIRYRIVFFTKIAAIFFAFLSGGYYLLHSKQKTQETIIQHTSPKIVLGNGKTVFLNQLGERETKETGIVKTSDKELLHCKPVVSDQPDTSMNHLILPAKTRYTIQLSDGSKIIVNANSTLSYPNTFYGNERRVEIQGEAYFEVAKGEKPFVVVSSGVEIKAYGTKFNVSNYHGKQVETVLTEGKVGVSISQGEEIRLSPNQKATAFLGDGQIFREDIQPDKYIAWIQGYFLFDGENLNEVLEKLEQWYGVEFDLTSLTDRQIPIVAKYSQDTPLEEILQTIELSVKITFINDRGKYRIKETGT